MTITLPPNAQRLLPQEFARRYALAFEGLVTHIGKRLKLGNPEVQKALLEAGAGSGLLPADLRVELFRAGVPGPEQILQFASMDGEPAVFTAPYKDLSAEQAGFCDIVVGYFDTRGKFDNTTGTPVGETRKTAEGYSDRLVADANQMVEDMRAMAARLTVQKEELDRTIAQHMPDGAAPNAHSIEQLRVTKDKAVALRKEAAELTAQSDRLKQDADIIQELLQLPDELSAKLSEVMERLQVDVRAFIELIVELKQLHPNWTTSEQVTSLLLGMDVSFRVAGLAMELGEDPLSKDASGNARMAMAYTCDALGLSTTEFLAGLKQWLLANPGRPASEYQDVVIPEDRRAELESGWQGLQNLLHRLHEMRDRQKAEESKDPQPATLDDWLTKEYPETLRVVADELHVSKRVIREILERWVNTGVIKFVYSSPGSIAGLIPNGWPVFVNRTERALKEIFEKRFKMLEVEPGGSVTETVDQYVESAKQRGLNVEKVGGEYRIKPGEHTYMRAIEAQYQALTDYLYATQKARDEGRTTIGASAVAVSTVDMIIETLKRADTFCWFEEPILAVQVASQSLPTSVRLTRDLTEHYACWWYFTIPTGVVREEAVQALLWGWDGNDVVFTTLMFASDGKIEGLVPSSRFYWKDGETLEHALRRNREELNDLRNPKGAVLDSYGVESDIETVMHGVEQLMRFFISGCLWIKQTILVHSKGHVERHARKRMEKPDGFNRPLSDVQIIQLRRRESVAPQKSDNPQAVEWSCRWVVKGFWRNQYYPSQGNYQPKWIDSFVKGPADKPLKVPTHRVYAVSR